MVCETLQEKVTCELLRNLRILPRGPGTRTCPSILSACGIHVSCHTSLVIHTIGDTLPIGLTLWLRKESLSTSRLMPYQLCFTIRNTKNPSRWIQSTSRSLVAGAEVRRRRSVQGQLHAKKCLILTNCLIHMSPCQSNQNKIKNKALVK